MPKDQEQTEAGEVLGGYEMLISILAKKKADAATLTKLITQDGPPHKQWQHTLVLSRLAELITFAEEATETTFEPLAGAPLTAGDSNQTLPVYFPAQSLEGVAEEDDLGGKLANGPAHEVAYTAVLLQAIEWLINTLFEEGDEEVEADDDRRN